MPKAVVSDTTYSSYFCDGLVLEFIILGSTIYNLSSGQAYSYPDILREGGITSYQLESSNRSTNTTSARLLYKPLNN